MKTCVAKLGQHATFFVKPNGSVTESVRPGYLWVEGERVVLGRPPEDFVIELDAQAIHRRAATLLGELGQLVNLREYVILKLIWLVSKGRNKLPAGTSSIQQYTSSIQQNGLTVCRAQCCQIFSEELSYKRPKNYRFWTKIFLFWIFYGIFHKF